MKSTRSLKSIQRYRSKLVNKIRETDPQLAIKLESVKLDWYRIRNATEEKDEADLYIYDEIMPAYMAQWFGGVSAEGLINELNEITASTINIHINSPGGSLFEGIAIYSTLMQHPANINVVVDSLAASAASIIAMSGDKITMVTGSQMMIHDAMDIVMGNPRELRDVADWLDMQSDNIANIYTARAGGDSAEWRAMMLKETWLFSEEAVGLGLADEVYVKPMKKMEEMPHKEEEEDPEEDDDSEEEESESNEEEVLDALMSARHPLTNRGFKYAGRKKAPAPTTNKVDELINLYSSIGGK